jgi:hypothetical protein
MLDTALCRGSKSQGVGGVLAFLFTVVVSAAGYLVYMFRDKLGEANAMKIQAFVDTAKSTFGGLAGDIGALKEIPTAQFEDAAVNAIDPDPIKPLEFSELLTGVLTVISESCHGGILLPSLQATSRLRSAACCS